MSSKSLANGDGFFGILDETIPPHEGRHGAHDSIAYFFAMNNDLDVVGQQST
jgi:hypothetical protein